MAGGTVLTMIDIRLYMDLPADLGGRAGQDRDRHAHRARRLSNIAIPAKVSFIATRSQFTPRTVRPDERALDVPDQVRIDPALLRAHAAAVRSGLPGVAYLRLDPSVEWPARLQRTVGS
jgi:HlyD family secretion protein